MLKKILIFNKYFFIYSLPFFSGEIVSKPVLAASSLAHDVEYGLQLSSIEFHNKRWEIYEFKPSDKGYIIGLYGAIITCTVDRIINEVGRPTHCEEIAQDGSYADHYITSLNEVLKDLPQVFLWYGNALQFEDKFNLTDERRVELTEKTIAFSRHFFSGLNIPVSEETFFRRRYHRLLSHSCLKGAIDLRRLFCSYETLSEKFILTDMDKKFLCFPIDECVYATNLDCAAYSLLKNRVKPAKGWILSAIEGMSHEDSLEFYNNDGLSLLRSWNYCSVVNPTRKDLVVYLLNSNGKIKITHVGIYLGEGLVESKPGNIDPGIYRHRIEVVPPYYGATIIFFRRIIRKTI